ncbi:MAG: helix-turn-helix transcriptional regulator [Jatrophihabitans sp.]
MDEQEQLGGRPIYEGTGPGRAPLIVVEHPSVHRAVADEVVGAGWALQPPGGPVDPASIVSAVVADGSDAQAAVLLAIRGRGLLIRARAERGVVDDLVEDLSRIAPVLFFDDASAIRLDPDTWRLLHALADGVTVSVAARTLHLSIRTANRRITEARDVMGAQTRAQLLRALTSADRVPSVKVSR